MCPHRQRGLLLPAAGQRSAEGYGRPPGTDLTTGGVARVLINIEDALSITNEEDYSKFNSLKDKKYFILIE